MRSPWAGRRGDTAFFWSCRGLFALPRSLTEDKHYHTCKAASGQTLYTRKACEDFLANFHISISEILLQSHVTHTKKGESL